MDELILGLDMNDVSRTLFLDVERGEIRSGLQWIAVSSLANAEAYLQDREPNAIFKNYSVRAMVESLLGKSTAKIHYKAKWIRIVKARTAWFVEDSFANKRKAANLRSALETVVEMYAGINPYGICPTCHSIGDLPAICPTCKGARVK